jgi:hypothetical protein
MASATASASPHLALHLVHRPRPLLARSQQQPQDRFLRSLVLFPWVLASLVLHGKTPFRATPRQFALRRTCQGRSKIDPVAPGWVQERGSVLHRRRQHQSEIATQSMRGRSKHRCRGRLVGGQQGNVPFDAPGLGESRQLTNPMLEPNLAPWRHPQHPPASIHNSIGETGFEPATARPPAGGMGYRSGDGARVY